MNRENAVSEVIGEIELHKWFELVKIMVISASEECRNGEKTGGVFFLDNKGGNGNSHA